MRLYVEPNGQCNDIEDLPMITLVRFGTLPHRRNGPVDVHGSYGPDDCTIVAINGAVGHAFLSRALLVEHDPLYAEGGIVLWDEQLRAIVNSKSPYDLQPRVGLANSYAVFAKTQGIFLVATELHLRDGTMTLHTIYVDMWRRVVHFGLNDGGTDMISFLIERADERDCETARDNLVNDKNFPVDPQRPDKKLVRVEITQVVEVMLKTRYVPSGEVPHVAYEWVKRPHQGIARGRVTYRKKRVQGTPPRTRGQS